MSDNSELPLTSTHWGTYRVETVDGKVKALHGFEQDADPSPIGPGIIDVLDGPTRIKAPMVRKSWLDEGPGANPERRGVDPFVQVTWVQAEQLVADELDRVKNKFGNNAIYAGAYGWASAGRFHHAQSQMRRFLNCIGGYTRSVNTYSFAAAEVVVPHVLGNLYHFLETATSWPSIIDNTKLFVAFGGVPVKNGQINAGGVGNHCQKTSLEAASDAGVEFVNIGPLRSDLLDSIGAQWLAPRPSTDTAILLGIAHTLYTEKLHDQDFIETYTTGFEKFVPYLTGETDGQAKSAEWAADISGLGGDEIRNLARRMASTRTMLSVSWSLTRQDHGEQPYWAAITVAAMLGQMGLPGGGLGFGYSATNSIGNHYASVPGASVPVGNNPVRDYIPVARISDMLMNPGKSYEYNGNNLTYPDIKMIYWTGGNPFHHHQDLNRMLKAWRKPETIIVHEWCWNALAKHADIVLPCTTPLERNDIAFSPRDGYIISMEQACEPAGDSRNDHDIFAGIAKRMGVDEVFTEGRDEADWLRWLYDLTRQRAAELKIEMPSLSDFQNDKWFKVENPGKPKIMLSDFRENPTANPLKTPSGKIEIFSETIDGFSYADCPGHPAWMEPAEWLGGGDIKHPLHLISNQPANKLHSQLDHGSYSRSCKVNGREPVMMHPKDARERNLDAGDLVKVFNDRGACLCSVVVSDDIMCGVICVSTGSWFDPEVPGEPGSICKHGNPNILTMDKGTSSLGQGPIAHSCLVEVALFEGKPPPVTAFEEPEIEYR